MAPSKGEVNKRVRSAEMSIRDEAYHSLYLPSFLAPEIASGVRVTFVTLSYSSNI